MTQSPVFTDGGEIVSRLELPETKEPLQFSKIKVAVAEQFQRMSRHELFVTGVDKDALWECYLQSFPTGTNPIFRVRTEHDCSCCRQFIRTVGNVVAIINGRLTSIWDITIDDPDYRTVANVMSAAAKSRPIVNRFLHTERTAGTDKNFEATVAGTQTWEHFFVNIPSGVAGAKNFVCTKAEIGPKLSAATAAHDVLLRGLNEITDDALDIVLELIGQNSLYRGEENKHAVQAFREVKTRFAALQAYAHDNFAWVQSLELPGSVSMIRNHAIGTLLIDLSEGRDVEGAVAAFENKVSAGTYKRPTAPVTKGMVDKAKATLQELGLTSALERRFAKLTDISINNLLFADRNARQVISGDVFDDIAGAAAVKARSFDKVEEVGIEKFLSDVLPKADSIELLVENRLVGNLVSLIAPVDPTAGQLFKWDNGFSWSYNGDFADSIKERVKKAGGNVVGELCCRLGWFNYDDLDVHMVEPNGYRIYFGTKNHVSPNGGRLDVDMNAMRPQTREAVENIFYATTAHMQEGHYTLGVHNYQQRETIDTGFEVEVDVKGAVYRFAYDRALKTNEAVVVATLKYTRAGGIEIISSLPQATASKKVWGIDTETFRRVNVAMLSPNHWDGHGSGHRHFFFMLDGCRNDGSARGFYNEFLKEDLDKHRKVFELVGSKMRADVSIDQMSGLGFSSTQRNHAIVRVKGAFTRTLRVTF
jgi:hypothetical protein